MQPHEPGMKDYSREPVTSRRIAHMFFFQLADTTRELVEAFTSLCAELLGRHPGQRHFSVGIRALEINRDVSGTNFEVSVHMIFEDIAAFQAYSASAEHERFITASAGMSPVRIVYDSYLTILREEGRPEIESAPRSDTLATASRPQEGGH